MVCKKCGKNIPDKSILCTECGAPVNPEKWEELSAEERAIKLWVQKEKKRRKNKAAKNLDISKAEPEQIKVSTVEGPMTDTVRKMVAELSEDKNIPVSSENMQEEQDISEECESVVQEQITNAQDESEPEHTEDNQIQQAEPEPLEESEHTSEPEEDEYKSSAPQQENDSSAQEEMLKEDEKEDKAADAETVGADTADVRGTSTEVSEENEESISMTDQPQDDFPDIHIPRIYAQAKYIPEKDKSSKWAEKAAEDEENDWEGFDPDAADWGCWDEQEHKSNIMAVIIVVIILAAAVGLAVYSCMTSELFTLF